MLWAKTKVLKAKETRKYGHVLSSAFLPATTCSSAAPTPELSPLGHKEQMTAKKNFKFPKKASKKKTKKNKIS